MDKIYVFLRRHRLAAATLAILSVYLVYKITLTPMDSGTPSPTPALIEPGTDNSRQGGSNIYAKGQISFSKSRSMDSG